jgi:hypothetical protein
MNWFKKRLAEKSTYIGLATTLLGVGTLTKMDEAPQLASAIQQAAEPLSAGDYATGLGVLLMGVLGVFMREKQD